MSFALFVSMSFALFVAGALGLTARPSAIRGRTAGPSTIQGGLTRSASHQLQNSVSQLELSKAGPCCFKLRDAEHREITAAFGETVGDWYVCSGQSEELTCILAPAWMNLPEGHWICSTSPFGFANGPDDSY